MQNGKQVTKFEVSWTTLWQLLLFIALAIVFFQAAGVWAALLGAIVISLGIDPVVGFLERKGVHRFLGTLMVFIVGIGIIVTAVYFLVPTLVTQVGAFISQFNDVISKFFGISIPHSAIKTLSENVSQILQSITSGGVSGVGGTISKFLQNVLYVAAAFVIGFYLSVEKDGPERLMRAILPDTYEGAVLTVFGRFARKIRRWLATQIGLSLFIGTMVALGMWILHVPYALTLGLLAALFELLPVIGPLLSGTVAFFIAVSQSPLLGLYVVIFFVVLQELEAHVVIPLVMGRTMRVHPVMVLISLLAGAKVAGTAGVLLAVPLALIAQETFNYFSEQKTARKQFSSTPDS